MDIGDDMPDRPAFTAARGLGGFGVAVHRPAEEADHALSGDAERAPETVGQLRLQ
jgi:hypothetical protein